MCLPQRCCASRVSKWRVRNVRSIAVRYPQDVAPVYFRSQGARKHDECEAQTGGEDRVYGIEAPCAVRPFPKQRTRRNKSTDGNEEHNNEQEHVLTRTCVRPRPDE